MTTTDALPGLVPDWTLGDRMAKALDVAGVTRGEMAAYLGVHTQTIRLWTIGQRKPKRGTLRLWALRTGVDLTWLDTGETGVSDT